MTKQRIVLVVAIILITAAIFYFESQRPKRSGLDGVDVATQPREEKLKKYEPAKELTDVQRFINAEPFAIADHIGKKVILIDFWTYSCINCQRTTPFLNAWWDRYKDDGLLIVGIHTPEFEFEKKYENVLQATKTFGIEYPVVQDNNFSTWSAYGNRYWPRKYLIDIDGFIVYDHIGEGAYEETEQKIREALMERKMVLGEDSGLNHDMANVQVSQKSSERPESPEVYFGAARNELYASGQKGKTGIQEAPSPQSAALNKLYLVGAWNIQNEYAQNVSSEAKVIFRFKARQVNLVAESDAPSTITILLDGKEMRNVEIQKSQLYQLVDLDEKGEHVLEIILPQSGVRLYTFTFG